MKWRKGEVQDGEYCSSGVFVNFKTKYSMKCNIKQANLVAQTAICIVEKQCKRRDLFYSVLERVAARSFNSVYTALAYHCLHLFVHISEVHQ